MPVTARYPSFKTGFSLVEMMVSLAVLSILVLLFNELFSAASTTITTSRKRMDADSEARLLLSRLGSDLDGMIKNTRVDYLFAKKSGNASDSFFFYSQAPAYFVSTDSTLYPTSSADPKSPLSLLGYRMNSNNQLERLGKGLTWDNQGQASAASSSSDSSYNSVVFLAPADAGGAGWNPLTLMTGAWPNTVGSTPQYYAEEPNFQVIAPDVFRLEFCYLLKDGTISDQPVMSNTPSSWSAKFSPDTPSYYTPGGSPPSSANNYPAYALGSRWAVNSGTSEPQYFICTSAPAAGSNANWGALGMQDVSAIIVTVAILDSNSQKLLGGTSLSTLAGLFPDSGFVSAVNPANAVLPGAAWQSVLTKTSPTFASVAHISPAAAAQVRIYQRFFYLNQ
jgi:prepilin-type N-terminal cleavage/methylation domain-containing protein